MKSTSLSRFAAFLLLATQACFSFAQVPAMQPSPREMWERVQKTLPPFSYRVLKDEVVPSETQPRQKLRRMEVRFSSQVLEGKSMDHTAVIFMPADEALLKDPARRGKVVIVGQRWNDTFMLHDYGDLIATRTGYPTMVLPNPGEFDGLDGEGRWITFTRTLTQTTRDAANHNYFRLAIPYLQGIRLFSEILKEENVRAIIGGHSKRATSAYTAAAIDPEHIAGVVYMGNESTFSRMASETFRPVSPFYTQKYVTCPVLYLGATNEDGYEMFNINKIQAVMERPWTIEYIPNFRHASSSEYQYLDWQMWIAHIFDGRPLAEISDLRYEETPQGTIFRAKVHSPNTIIQVEFWYVYCDDVPTWRDLVWYPTYKPTAKGNDEYEAFVDGILPDAWYVEVKDTAQGFSGYLSSLPQDITHKPTQERVSHGWKSRTWKPKPPPATTSQPAASGGAMRLVPPEGAIGVASPDRVITRLVADVPSAQPRAPPIPEYFPGAHWDKPGAAELNGWSVEKLDSARQYGESIGSVAVFIVHHGRLVYEWGPTEKRYNVHSIRKSYLSALYGIHLRAGELRIDDTMAKLGIEDNEPVLTAVEKQATVSDLLRARSGVYHPAAYETASMKAARPPRYSHAPGTFWYYNNWDFNVLGTIFRQSFHKSIGAEFDERLSKPLLMEDFRLEDAREHLAPDSIHPAYPLWLSARDMARFGLLMLRQGRWGNRQIIPADWVAESTRSYSAVRDAKGELHGGYGYMWWTELNGKHLDGVDLPGGSYSARGAGGHHILIVPGLDLVIVHRTDTDESTNGKAVNITQFGQLVKQIIAAMPSGARTGATTRPSVAARPGDTEWLPTALDELVPSLMTQHKVPGVAIVGIEGGRISWERQYGVSTAGEPKPVDAQTIFEVCSMSKPPFAYVVLKLVEQGKLDLDRPLVEYLDTPYLPDEPKHKLITARMVLTHTTGLPNWREGGLAKGGPLKLIADPGTKYTYSGEGFLYLQRVVEHITGKPMKQFMQESLFDPLGIAVSSYVWEDRFDKLAAAGHDSEGKLKPNRPHYTEGNAAYSLYCTPAEYAAFIVEIMKKDRSAAHSLSAASVAAMLKPTVAATGDRPIMRGGKRHADVAQRGLGWAIDATESGDRICHGGSNGTGFRCFCEFDVQRGEGIVIMTNAAGGAALWTEVMAKLATP